MTIGRFTTPSGGDWSLTAGAAYTGDRVAGLDGSSVQLPAYWKVKAAVDYALTDRVAVRLEPDNLLDEHYAASSCSRLWIVPGAPLSLRASLRFTL